MTGLEDVIERLRLAVADAARLARAVRESWAGPSGEALADRITMVGRALDRQADRAAEIARTLAQAVTEEATGPLVPSTTGRRPSESRGVRLPLLADTPDERPP
ncbi:hypothetical protein [Pseudonocardia ailaonensis]|uniref:hypothetical protein n=1 Tax=Pseudonocardia ailaonensis TaxID=367279 RepID=UPI0031E2730B